MKLITFLLPFTIILGSHLPSFGFSEADNAVRFSENKGQWNSNILFRLRFRTGALFLEKDRLTFTFVDGNDWEEMYHAHHGAGPDTFDIRGHSWHIRFANANTSVAVSGFDAFSHYENYFLGDSPEKWQSQVRVFAGVRYNEIFPGIDFIIQGKDNKLKYSFIVHPGANVDNIRMIYEGLDSVWIDNGKLTYATCFNTVYEEAPYSYQEVGAGRLNVRSQFTLNGVKAGFRLFGRYHSNKPVIIDPVFVFGTFTGSLADNFGYTATYDNAGNFYTGGIARDVGYPTTPGAFQLTFAGGAIVGVDFDQGYDADISITKFNPTGTALIYSTYLGGSINDQPHSLIVNSNNELLVYGRSNSTDFPTTVGAYDRTQNGSMDIIVTKFNTTGTALTASTFIGGTGDDGVNIVMSPRTYQSLKYNYADDARGEINIDNANNVYVASSTRSTNFPVTAGAYQNVLRGSQDAVVFKMNSNLTALTFSTYLGGTGDDAGYGIYLDNQNRPYVCGGTASSNFPTTTGSLYTTFRGGLADGYVTLLNTNGTALVNSTYIGTTAYDQTHFVQLDASGNVYVTGQTAGAFPVTAGVYSNPNSGQYIMSLTPNLASIRFSTVFGLGDGTPDLSPTAFLVDVCDNIYFSGWGGAVNGNVGYIFGMPLTSDALQTTTDGSDFYFFILSRNAQSLVYASYFGGPISYEHVDGGTSRFDKNGVIYQAVCAGCGGNSDFPSVPGVWSQNNLSQYPAPNCNEGSAKFAFQLIGVDVDVLATPATSGCGPLTVTFDGQPVNVIDFNWNFGDGTTSTLANPTHTFTSAGVYDVRLVGIDSTTCAGLLFSDTSSVRITVFANPVANAGADISICSGESAQLTATGGNTYRWSTNQVTPTINVSPVATSTYSVTVTNANGCTAADDVIVEVRSNVSVQRSASICNGDSLFVGGNFQTSAGLYFDTLIAANGCDSVVSTNLSVLSDTAITRNITICEGDSFFAGGDYQTLPGQYFDSLPGSDGCDSVIITILVVFPVFETTVNAEICDGDGYFAGGDFQTTSGTYYDTLAAANGCDSIIITHLTVNPNFITHVDVTICSEDSFFVGGGNQNTSGVYYDTLLTIEGCDSVIVTNLTVLPLPVTMLNPEICEGESYFAGGNFQTATGTYFDTLFDANGCDSIIITNLTVNPNFITHVDVTICSEDSFFVGGGNQNTSGVYYDTLLTIEGCDSVIVTDLTVLPLPVTIIDTQVCDGTAYFAGGAFQTTSGTYYDTLKTSFGCDSILITNLIFSPALSLSFTTEDASCFGACDASIACNVSGGQAPLSFNWSNSGSSPQITNLCAGAYDVTVTDANGCTASGSAAVSEPAPITVELSHRDIPCDCINQLPDYGICVIDFAGLPHGTILNEQYAQYGIHISGDVLNSTALDKVIVFNSFVSGSQDPDLQVDIGNLAILPQNLTDLNGDGLIDSPNDNDIGGRQIYTFDQPREVISFTFVDKESPPGTATAYDLQGSIIASVTIPAATNGSVQTVMMNAPNVSRLVIDYRNDSGGVTAIQLGCTFQCCDGLAIASPSGGTPPYDYQWSNGVSSDTISGLCPGAYIVTVTDANGCSLNDSVMIDDFDEIQISITVDDLSENCSASLNRLCELNFTNLPAGTTVNEQYAQYGIHIFGDAYGTFADRLIIFDADASGTPDPDLETATGHLLVFPENTADTNHDGLVDSPDDQGRGGKITLTFDRDMDVISFVFVDKENNAPGTAKAYNANNTLIKTVAIPNAGNGSVQTIIVNASGVRKLVLDYRDSGGVSDFVFGCAPVCCDGAASVSVSGGNPPYSYQWSNGSGATLIDSLCPGDYTVTVTDEDSCIAERAVTIYDCTLSISGMTLVREEHGGEVAPLTEGMTISLDTLCPFNIRADICHSPDGSIAFLLNGELFDIENTEPYALAGDNPASGYHGWMPAPGNYTLTAIPYSSPNATGSAGRPLTVRFNITGQCSRLKTAVEDLNSPDARLLVYPVPFDDKIIVDLSVEKPGSVALTVTDVIGRELIKQKYELPIGKNTLTLSTGNWIANAIYFLEVRMDGSMKIVRVVKSE